MTTKTIFNMDVSLKRAAMRKAKSEGMNLTTMLNIATRAFVDKRLVITAFERDLAEAKADVKAGRIFRGDIRDLIKKIND